MDNQPEYYIRRKDKGETFFGVFHIIKKTPITHIGTFYNRRDAEEYVTFMMAKMEIRSSQE